MGAYLSEPITEKISSDEANDLITCGASSMQGWRMSQEDAHNCILDFDTNTSLFAVYDGHGGAEVALYCAQKLPDFLKNTEEYQKSQFEEALKKAFIGFDATLTQSKVHAELKALIPADKRDGESETEEDVEDAEDEIEDLAELCQESRMPLNELLEKYKDRKQNLMVNRLKKSEETGTKPISPYLRGRRSKSEDCGAGGSSSGYSTTGTTSEAISSNSKRKLDEGSEVSSSTVSTSKNQAKDKQLVAAGSSSSSSSSSSTAVASAVAAITVAASAAASTVAAAAASANEVSGTSNGPTSSSNDVNSRSSSSTATKVNYITPDSSSTKAGGKENDATGSAGARSTGSSVATKSEAKSSSASSLANGEVVSGGTGASATVADKSQENEISTNSPKAESVSSSSSSSSSSGSANTATASGHSSAENGEVSSNSSSSTSSSSGNSQNNISSTNDRKAKKNLPVLDSDDTSSEDEEDASYNEDKSSTEDGEDCEMESEEDTDEEEDDEDDMFPDQDIDESFLNDMVEGPGSSSGCTAVVALMVGRDLYVANAGDSRCVVCRNGEALEMSIDHKPEDIEELERICKAGGDVSLDGRVNGGLNLSRAIGDHAYKQNMTLGPEEQMISALPDVKKITISDGDEFMIIACDGIWNFMSSEEVVKFVKPKLDEGREKLSTICEELFTNCLATDTLGDGTGCDNMTAVLIRFKPKLIEQPLSDEKPAEKLDDFNKKNKIHARDNNDDETAAAVDAIDDVSSRKRSASPLLNDADEKATPTDSHKRLKTDGTGKASMMVVDDENDKVVSLNAESLTESAPALDTAAAT